MPAMNLFPHSGDTGSSDPPRRHGDVSRLPNEAVEPVGGISRPIVRVLLVDPMTMTRQSLALCFQAIAPDLEVQAVAKPPDEPPDQQFDLGLVVAGFRPVASEAVLAEIARLQTVLEPVPIAILGGSDDPHEVILALNHGVRGYISADLDMAVVVAAIHLVSVGGSFIPSSSLLKLA